MKFSRAVCYFIIVAVAGALLLLLALPGHRRDARLADGSRLVVEKVAYGKLEPFQYGGWREKLKQHLPPALVSHLFPASPGTGSSSWVMNTVIRTNNDALYIYITRGDPATGDYADTGMMNIELLDEHGCAFIPSRTGGEDDGRLGSTPGSSGSSVGWCRFDAFPRHERNFRMQVFGHDGTIEAEFVLANPVPPSAPTNHWATEPLPITKSIGDVAFTLTGITIQSNTFPRGSWNWEPQKIVPEYEILESGNASTNWRALDMDLYDGSGNFASEMVPDFRFLCPRESAWKMRVKFFGSEQSHAASNAVWTLHGLSVPAPGKFNLLSGSNELQGVEVKAVAFAGTGNFEYLNNLPASGSPLAEEIKRSILKSTWSAHHNGRNIYSYKVQGMTPHLFIEIGDLTDDQRFTARATDDQGREFYAYQLVHYAPTEPPKGKPSEINYLNRSYLDGGGLFLAFDLPADTKTVDVTFCVHSCYTPEFIFKPPTQ
jgi:hypothetical protein